MTLPSPTAPPEQFLLNVTTSIQTTWGGEAFWFSIALTAVAISFLFVAIAYMLSELLRSPELQAWAKNELAEAAVSALMVGLVFSSLTVLNTIVSDMTGGYSHIGLGYAYLSETLNDLTRVYTRLLTLDAGIGTLGTMGTVLYPQLFGIPIGTTMPNVGISPLVGLTMVNGMIVKIADAAALTIVNLMAQQALLEFIYEQFFTFFLPFGLILRTFSLTRKLGSTIIALAISGYVVFPLTLALNKGIYEYDRDVVAQYSAAGDIPPEWRIVESDLGRIGKIAFFSPLSTVGGTGYFNLTFLIQAPNGTYDVWYREWKEGASTDFVWLGEGAYAAGVPVNFPVSNPGEGLFEYGVVVTTINATPCSEGCPVVVRPDGTSYGGCDPRGYCQDMAEASLNVTVKPACKWYQVMCWLRREYERAGEVWKSVGGQLLFAGITGVGVVAGSPLVSLLGAVGSGSFQSLWPTYYVYAAYDYITCDANTAQQPCSSCKGSVPALCPNAGLTDNPTFTWLVPDEWALPIVVRKLLVVTVLTVVDIIIVITFFRSLSGSLGGETQLAGMTKLV
ncbi:MAG: hypothetical protein QXH27_00190 [Candidatus Micrarchaeia archaeon]